MKQYFVCEKSKYLKELKMFCYLGQQKSIIADRQTQLFSFYYENVEKSGGTKKPFGFFVVAFFGYGTYTSVCECLITMFSYLR